MAAQNSRIVWHEEPKPISLDRVLGQPVTSLLVAGIVNPFGPTLTAVAALGIPGPGAQLAVVRLLLNPFSQQVEAVGELAIRKDWSPLAVISSVFHLFLASACPTLLLPSVHLDASDSIPLHAEFLRGFSDARAVLERVTQYLGNPWDRVSMEMRTATDQLGEQTAGLGGAADPEPLGDEEASEFAGLLLSRQHFKPELQAFSYAWNGSIQHIAPGLASMSVESFTDVLGHLVDSCAIPDLSGAEG